MIENAAEPQPTAPRVPLQELVGTRLGDYQINRVLGYGSMGVVFEADHVQLGRRVALKALPPGLGATEKAIQRFLREAQAVAQLSHENIVPIYEISCQGAIHYYAMQFLDGEPLDRVIRRGPLDPMHASRLCCTAARAIHFAHQHGIIHRDIKPANLILQGDGRLVLTDFGLARPEQGGGITDSGAMVGTPLYMSPEQVRAKRGEVDRRTDVYSLGATLYEMLAGRPPFTGESTQEILQSILELEPRSPRTMNPAVPADLDVVVMKTLEKEPKRRYQSALELAQDLERFLENEPILARRSSIVDRGWRRVKKNRTIAVLSLVIAVVALGFSYLMKAQRDSERGKRFQSAMVDGRGAFVDENYLAAFTKYDEALGVKAADLDARLGRARSLCFMGQEWERANQLARGETRPQLAARFTSVEKLYADALADVRVVADAQPENALAVFFRGFLGWRSREKLDGGRAAVEDLALAEKLGESDWATQAELAKFRYGLAKDPRRGADQCNELLQQALTNASRAVKLAEEDNALPPRFVARVHQLRAEIYSLLYDLSGNASTYLDLAEGDGMRALDIVVSDPTLATFLASVESRRDDARKQAQTAANRTPSRATDSRAANDLARGVLTLLAVAEKSDQSKALADLLQRGGELLAAGWQETDSIRGEFMNRFVNPYLAPNLDVSGQARIEAAAEADAAHRILQSGLDAGSLTDASRAEARAHLLKAVEKNPRNAQYFFDLAVVEQDMKELDAAHDHLERATVIAPSNPLFFHQLATVDESRRRPAEALEHARKTEELAPDGADFVADHARLALDAEAAEADAPKRSSLHAEAVEAVGRLEKLAAQHAQLEPLRARLAKAPETPPRDG